MTQKLVLVTGGAGFVGIHVCRLLLARGYAVRSLDAGPFNYPERASIDVMRGDIRDGSVVAHAMRGVSHVVHAASAPEGSPTEEVFSTNVAGTWTVLQTAARNRVARFVFLSSARVYGCQAHHLMHEEDPLHGTGAYAESKIEAEHLCQSARLSGLSISILRPTSLVGSERSGVFAKLCEQALAGRNFAALGAGSKPCQAMDIEDLCEAIYLCMIMRPDLVNDTFNLGARAFGTARESFQAVLDRAGHQGKVISLPLAPAGAAVTLLQRLTGSRKYAWLLDTAGQDSYVSMRHIEGKLGFRARYSTFEALLREYDRYARLRGGLDERSAASGCPEATW